MPSTHKTTVIKKTVIAKKQPVKVPNTHDVAVFSLLGKKDGTVSVSDALMKSKITLQLLGQAVRVYQANTHQGTQSTKTRGEVSGSTRKIYRQKGTGRARHGANKAPIFVGGGIAFGPKPRDFGLLIPKKMRRRALQQIIGEKFRQESVTIVSGFEKATGKTKEVVKLLTQLELQDKKILLVLDPAMKKAAQGARNLNRVTVRMGINLSSLDVISNEHLVLAKEAYTDWNKKTLIV
ncbi:MAG: 50S ribosomal protein L4 [Patescibacteria group bacterium]